MQLVRHANRGRLLLRTPGPVPYGICKCSFVETTDTQLYITPVYDTFPWLDFLPNLTLLLNIGFHRASATGVACQQGTLTPPDTWSCPTLGLACVLISRPISPELVLSPDFWISNIPRYFSFAYVQSPNKEEIWVVDCTLLLYILQNCSKFNRLSTWSSVDFIVKPFRLTHILTVLVYLLWGNTLGQRWPLRVFVRCVYSVH